MITYKKLFCLLLDRNMKKGEFAAMAKIPPNTMQRLTKDKGLNTETINRICIALNCQPGDIMEFVPSEEERELLERCNKMQNTIKETSAAKNAAKEIDKSVKSQVKYKLKV